jgi:hypothetical protein
VSPSPQAAAPQVPIIVMSGLDDEKFAILNFKGHIIKGGILPECFGDIL